MGTLATQAGLVCSALWSPPRRQRLGLTPGPAQPSAQSLPRMMLAIRVSGGRSHPTRTVFLGSTEQVDADTASSSRLPASLNWNCSSRGPVLSG